MEKNELFAEYINGSLPADAEHRLFTSMSFDEELRSDFRRFIVIDKKLKENAKCYLPPSDVTNAIFAGVGMTLGGSKKPEEPGFFKKYFSKSKIFMVLITVALAFILSFFIFNSLFDINKNYRAHLQESGSISGTANNKPDTRNAAGTTDKRLSDPMNYPVSGSYATAESLKESRKHSRLGFATFSGIARNPVNLRSDDYSDYVDIYSDKNDILEPAIASIDFTGTPETFSRRMELNENFLSTGSVEATHGLTIDEYNTFFDGFAVEVKNSANWNLKKATVYPSETPVFPNMDFSVLYAISNDIQIGAEIRQETLFLRYGGIDSIGRNYSIDQNPNLTSFGLFARFEPFEILGFHSLFQIGASVNSFGIINRLGAGVEYKLTDNIRLNAIALYSGFWYSHRSSAYYNDKVSLMYGINYSF